MKQYGSNKSNKSPYQSSRSKSEDMEEKLDAIIDEYFDENSRVGSQFNIASKEKQKIKEFVKQ